MIDYLRYVQTIVMKFGMDIWSVSVPLSFIFGSARQTSFSEEIEYGVLTFNVDFWSSLYVVRMFWVTEFNDFFNFFESHASWFISVGDLPSLSPIYCILFHQVFLGQPSLFFNSLSGSRIFLGQSTGDHSHYMTKCWLVIDIDKEIKLLSFSTELQM